ncbi:ENDD1 protein, partial [Certhia familiaris]|nr:ENDD1 protein [Certhia familiaris]
MLGLLLLQVLASCLWLAHTEVVTSFASCPQFFYAGTTPNDVLNPQNAAWICQFFSNKHHFATLYDRDRRIPVYSAYVYEPGNKRPSARWFVEPQLMNKNYLRDMEREETLMQKYKLTLEDIKKSQAVEEDYKVLTGLDRGHLTPSGHMNDIKSKAATFTLTNVVPQDSSLNNGQWNVYEFKTMSNNAKGCTRTYVITGAVPGNTKVAGERVNRPSHIWSAACCLGKTGPRDAWGAIAENDKNQVENLKLGELEDRLTALYRGRRVTLFNNACPRK